jgi:hypothetical protein
LYKSSLKKEIIKKLADDPTKFNELNEKGGTEVTP